MVERLAPMTEARANAIIITCAVNHVPPMLIEQLEDCGRLILPLGIISYYQTLTLIERDGENLIVTHYPHG